MNLEVQDADKSVPFTRGSLVALHLLPLLANPTA